MNLTVTKVTSHSNRDWRARRAVDRPTGPSRAYVSVEGETFWEDFGNRTTRPYNAWRPLVEAALRKEGVELTSLSWSRNAGCTMCPCSPGFIVNGIKDTARGRDYWVTITADEPQTTDPAVADNRMAQLASHI